MIPCSLSESCECFIASPTVTTPEISMQIQSETHTHTHRRRLRRGRLIIIAGMK